MAEYKIYKTRWFTELYEVDQYDHRNNTKPFYEKAFDTRQEADFHLKQVATRTSIGRWVPKDTVNHPSHSYVDGGIRKEPEITDVRPSQEAIELLAELLYENLFQNHNLAPDNKLLQELHAFISENKKVKD
jgi:hypothetical protein